MWYSIHVHHFHGAICKLFGASVYDFTNPPSIVASMLEEDHSNNYYKYVFFNVIINNFNVRVSLYRYF